MCFFTIATTAIEAKRESCGKNVNIKAEAKVSFDGSNVGEIEPLTPEEEKELTVDSSSPILKENTEQEKVKVENMLEIASPVEGKFPDFRDKQSEVVVQVGRPYKTVLFCYHKRCSPFFVL